MISAKAAIDYNNACNYPSNLINVILRTVRGPMSWQWNEPGVTAVSKWQESNKLLADGMVGKKSLEKLISELASCGKTADADLLRQFLAKAKVAQPPKPKTTDIVASFPPPRLVYPFRFEKYKIWNKLKGKNVPYWSACGTFEVEVKLSPSLSEDERLRYEYRQFIKGRAWVQDGQWNQNNVWIPASGQVDISSRFEVPPDPVRDPRSGITPNFKEDGKYPQLFGSEILDTVIATAV